MRTKRLILITICVFSVGIFVSCRDLFNEGINSDEVTVVTYTSSGTSGPCGPITTIELVRDSTQIIKQHNEDFPPFGEQDCPAPTESSKKHDISVVNDSIEQISNDYNYNFESETIPCEGASWRFTFTIDDGEKINATGTCSHPMQQSVNLVKSLID